MWTVREALNRAMSDEMENDSNIFIIGEEVAEYNGAYKVTQGLLAKFGAKRVIDTPITEYGFTGLAVGAAFKGLRPIVEFMSWNFAMQAIDHIINSAAKTNYMSNGRIKCPIVFRGANGSSKSTAAQHSQSFTSWYANVPGLIVISPFDANSAYELLRQAIRNDNPVVFLENELLYGEKFEEENLNVEIGKARVVKNGDRITMVSFSRPLKYCIEACEGLENKGVSVELIDLHTIKPLDIDTIVGSVKKTNNLIVVEENWSFCGIASEIITQINEKCFDYLDSEPTRVTAEDTPVPYSQALEDLSQPSAGKIVSKVLKQLAI